MASDRETHFCLFLSLLLPDCDSIIPVLQTTDLWCKLHYEDATRVVHKFFHFLYTTFVLSTEVSKVI
jgi:hypothetical protein